VLSAKATISVASRNDAAALAAMRSAVARGMTERFGHGHWSAYPSRAEVARQLRASLVLVARSGAQIIGTVRLVRALPGLFDAGAFTPVANPWYVLGLAVAPQCRGQGVGRELMDAAKEAARSRGADALWLDAYVHEAGAGPFYEKCGFRQVGRTQYREVPLNYYEWLVSV
jgi:ribosomal protein S18 acetylase RimI-like enzyme